MRPRFNFTDTPYLMQRLGIRRATTFERVDQVELQRPRQRVSIMPLSQVAFQDDLIHQAS